MTQDEPAMAEVAKRLFDQAQSGAITITTCEAMITEVVHILSSKALYNLPRAEIKKHLRNFLSIKGLTVDNKSVYLRALDLPRMKNATATKMYTSRDLSMSEDFGRGTLRGCRRSDTSRLRRLSSSLIRSISLSVSSI